MAITGPVSNVLAICALLLLLTGGGGGDVDTHSAGSNLDAGQLSVDSRESLVEARDATWSSWVLTVHELLILLRTTALFDPVSHT